MPVGQLVALRNEKDTVTVLSPDPKNTANYLEFQAKGDAMGLDVQYVSEEMAASPACVRAVMHGVLSLDEEGISNPEMAQLFQNQMRVAREQRERAEAAAREAILRPADRDMIGIPCVGPGTQPGVNCGDMVPMAEKLLATTAPLCSRHKDQPSEYIPVVEYEGEKEKTRWVRRVITAREKESG